MLKMFQNKKENENTSAAKYLSVFRRSKILREHPSHLNIAVRNYFH